MIRPRRPVHFAGTASRHIEGQGPIGSHGRESAIVASGRRLGKVKSAAIKGGIHVLLTVTRLHKKISRGFFQSIVDTPRIVCSAHLDWAPPLSDNLYI
jgi:hypothetical protein